MSEEANGRKGRPCNPTLQPHAHELCRKAKETLEKANKLLAESGKHRASTKPCDGDKKS